MAEKMTMLNAGALEDMLHAKALEMETDLSNIRAAYMAGVKAGTEFMAHEAEERIDYMATLAISECDKAKEMQVKTIGVAEWEKDENGNLICSHCGGEAWARKYNDSGEGQQMPSQHCPWCGYEMRYFK